MWFPAVFKLLHHATAGLTEARVTQRTAVHEHLAPCGTDSLLHFFGRSAGDALVALAMVVGTHVEVHVVVAVPPLDEFLGGIHHLSGSIGVALDGLDGLLGMDLCQQPAAGNDRMGLQQFERRVGAHLTRDDAQQVILNAQHVDGRELAILDDEVQRALKRLVLLSFPVETHTDGHRLERKRGFLGINRLKQQFAITLATPLYLPIYTAGHLPTATSSTIHAVVTIEHELHLWLIHDAHPHLRYLILVHIVIVYY